MPTHDPGLYARSFSDVYDAWYGSLDDPFALVSSLQRHHGRGATIVELGSGTGRLATPLYHAGYNVISVDISHPMLAHAAPGPHQTCADMAVMPLRASCADAVVIAYNTLFNLASRPLQQRCFDEAARILAPGGVLAVDTFVAPSDPAKGFGLTTREHPTDHGASLTILSGPDPFDADVIVGSHIERSAALVCRPWRLAYQTPTQLDDCAAKAGLSLLRRSSDWADAEFNQDSQRHISWYEPSSTS